MNARRKLFIVLAIASMLIPVSVAANGASEAAGASGSGHGKYLVGEGIIIPPSTIYPDSYIASIDYTYPIPEQGIGLTVYSGHRQIPSSGQDELIHIGVQGGKMNFDDLPPMNVAFVIDKSGSMRDEDKMDWVKESFYVFIEAVRDEDFVSLVVFDGTASVVFPSTQMNSRDKRLRFKSRVSGIVPGGATNLREGLELGYEQVMANYRADYTNRVLFLTDGVGKPGDILEMAGIYKELGVNVSTIGLGRDFDMELMTDLARAGGGSSRFVSDREEMEKIFGTELDRAFVAVARDLRIELTLPPGTEVLETWGYNHQISGNTVNYSLPTLHHGDYETMLAKVRIPETSSVGSQILASVKLDATDVAGNPISTNQTVLSVDIVTDEAPVSGYSDAMVLKSGTILDYAENLIHVGNLYYTCREEIEEVNVLRDELWRSNTEADYSSLSNPRIRELENSIAAKMRRAFDVVVSTKKNMENVRLRLDSEGFDDELEILEKYLHILGEELEMTEDRLNTVVRDEEIPPIVSDRPLTAHIANLFNEMTLDLRNRRSGILAVSGFTMRDKSEPELLDLLDEAAMTEFGRIDTLTMVERTRLDEVLAEQQLQLSGLVDTGTAIRVGELLAAEFIVTGSVIEMASSVVIFGRVINVESGEVESVAQVIVPKDADVRRLLIG